VLTLRDPIPPHGLVLPCVTPLRGGKVDEESLRRLVRHSVSGGFGADVLFVDGTTGEANRLDNGARDAARAIATDEARQGNEARDPGHSPTQIWLGATGDSPAATLGHLRTALTLGADAAVIAPRGIPGLEESDILRFFRRDIGDLLDACGRHIPIYLYDNADIAVDQRAPWLRVALAKQLARLDFVWGIKVSAPARVLGNYLRAARHFNDEGRFGLYVGNARLVFDVLRPRTGALGVLGDYWRRWLWQGARPSGVVSGPANVAPREWQRAWRACETGETELIDAYEAAFDAYAALSSPGGKKRSIATAKALLAAQGVIATAELAPGTPTLDATESQALLAGWRRWRDSLPGVAPLWTTPEPT
jgi:dihydrodipicolinate synthase/N-acetylneuraminate lyase